MTLVHSICPSARSSFSQPRAIHTSSPVKKIYTVALPSPQLTSCHLWTSRPLFVRCSTTMKFAIERPVGIYRPAIWTPSYLHTFSVHHPRQSVYSHWAKAKGDPKKRRNYLETKQKAKKQKWDRVENLDYRERLREKDRKAFASRRNETTRMSTSMHNWLLRYAWVRETLPWKTHWPVVQAEKVEQECVGCGWARRGGLRLTWRSLSDQSILCHGCYMQQGDLAQALPHGYEHVKSLSDLRARKNHLDGPTSREKWDVVGDRYRKTHNVYLWMRYVWTHSLPWKTHGPVCSANKVEHICSKCTSLKSLKLWWQSLTSEEFLCNRCYTMPDWPEIMPKGYEDVTTYKELKVRKEQLDQQGIGAPEPETPSSLPSLHSTTTRSESGKSSPLPPPLQSTTTRPALVKPSGIVPSSSRHFSHSCTSHMTKAEYEKLQQDPAALRAYLDRLSAYKKNHYDVNSEARERRRRMAKVNFQERSYSKEHVRMAQHIKRWVRLYTWARTSLPWTTHQPMLFKKPVEHYCKGCGFTRRGGLTLWWKQKHMDTKIEGANEDGEYLCHSCYVPKDNPRAALPRGYEDVNNYHELVTRKKMLEGPDSLSCTTIDESVRKSRLLWLWCQKQWIRELAWKTHQPVLSETKTQKQCASCDYARIRAMKLWWREIAQDQEATGQSKHSKHICHNCYTKPEWTEIMPIGYEEARSYKDLSLTRKKQSDEQAGHV